MLSLPVIAVLKEAISTVWLRRKKLVLALLALVMLQSVLDVALNRMAAEEHSALLLLLPSLISLLIFVLYTVTCHRIILLDDDAVPTYGPMTWSSRETRFLGWLLAFAITFFAYAIPVMMIIGPPEMDAMALAAGFGIIILPAAYLVSRLSLLLPATALDQRHDLAWAWRISQNNGWRLTLVVNVIPAPIFLLSAYYTPDNLVLDFLTKITYYTLAVFEIALLSVCYRHLSAMHDPTPESSSNSEQLDALQIKQ